MKKRAYLLLLPLFCMPALRAQELPRIVSYDLAVEIDVPARQVAVDGTLEVDFCGSDSIPLLLRHPARIEAMRLGDRDAAYRFDTLAPSPARFIPQGRALTVYRPEGSADRCRIETHYTLDMHGMEGPAQSFDDRWIEIGYYTGWYPVCSAAWADRSRMRVGITDGYKVEGSGIVSRTADHNWEINQPWASFDNVILASPELKSRRTGGNGTTIEIIYTDYPETDVDAALQCGCDALQFFRGLYRADSEENARIKFALSSSGSSGGYSRKNFIVLISESFDEYARKVMAHEIAHFWWNKAPVDSWHDWLNESFAEFSALQYLRKVRGEEEYADCIETYRRETRDVRPIWEIDRNDRQAFAALYKKGSVLLDDLLVRVGEETFYDFLSAVIRARIADTNSLLDLAESRLGRGHRDWIERRLKA